MDRETRNSQILDKLFDMASQGDHKAIKMWLEHVFNPFIQLDAEKSLDVIHLADLINNPVESHRRVWEKEK